MNWFSNPFNKNKLCSNNDKLNGDDTLNGDDYDCEPIPDASNIQKDSIRLYELTVEGDDFVNTYSDLADYSYAIDNGILHITMWFGKVTPPDYRQIKYAASSWKKITSNNQSIKTADLDQVKTAWENPEKEIIPEFPITLGDPAI